MSGETDQVRWRGVQPVDGIRGIWPARNSTRINMYASSSGTDVVLLYEIPAGKLLFLSSGFITTRHTAEAAEFGALQVRNAADAIQYSIISQRLYSVGQVTTPLSYYPALEVPAEWKVTIEGSSGAIEAFGAFFGWLEDE